MTRLHVELEAWKCRWISEAIRRGALAQADVRRADLRAVTADSVRRFERVHWCSGVGGWDLALDRAGWPGGRAVWTASLPCQPFSDAGARRAFDDERHLWPAFRELVARLRPPTLFLEQVSSREGLAWLDSVSDGLEAEGYAVGALDLCAASVGAPHRRQRLYVVADSNEDGRGELGSAWLHGEREQRDDASRRGADGALWGRPEWVECEDPSGPRLRPIEPGSFPLADGVPHRARRLGGYGDAIVLPLAAAFVRAFLDLARASA